MDEQWNEAWRDYAEKKRLQWCLIFPSVTIDALLSLRFYAGRIDSYSRYDVYTVSCFLNGEAVEIIIETPLASIHQWSILTSNGYSTLQSHLSLTDEEHEQLMRTFVRFDLFRWVARSDRKRT